MSGRRADQIQKSWVANAHAWIHAVRSGSIESRRVATDRAVVEAVMRRAPARVLDVGCGEGWLCRVLASQGVAAVGTDASLPLIEAARAAGGGEYHCVQNLDLAGADELGRFDLVVCNFSLLEQDLEPVLLGLKSRLRPHGALVIQTLHPRADRGPGSYRDGWRTESFDTLGPGFVAPMPWYFRTVESWLGLLSDCGWRATDLSEPADPRSGRALSLLIEAVAALEEREGHAR